MERLKSMFYTFGYFLEKAYVHKRPFCHIFSLVGENVSQSNV